MKNKMSFFLLIGFFFLAYSCKTEAKSGNNNEEPTTVETTDVPESDQVTQVPEDSAEAEVTEKEDDKPKMESNSTSNEKEKNENNSIPSKEETKKTIETKVEEISEPTVSKEEKNAVDEIKEQVITSKPEIVKVEDKIVEVEDPKPAKDVEVVKPEKPEITDVAVGFPNHSKFDQLLKAHVSSSGVVDYAGLKKQEAVLDEYLKALENNAPETTWNRSIELAYWINAYNAYTIKLILKNYPVKSITDLHGGKPWDVKWINLDGKSLSLNNIENDIIRPKYNEPRIHFAVNCAAKSCPPLLNGAFKAKSLEAQLETQTKKFINNSSYNTLGKNEINVSKIFEWYGVDFGDVASFVLNYADSVVKPSAKVTFMEYDWSLNGK